MFDPKYRVLKLIEMVGGKITNLKRLQKLGYVVRREGFPLTPDFSYHQYGPYSQELDALVHNLTVCRLVDETSTPNGLEYKITEEGRKFIKISEENHLVETYDAGNNIRNLAMIIKEQDPSLLELTSIVLFLQDYGDTRRTAIKRALNRHPYLKGYVDKAKKLLRQIDSLSKKQFVA